MGDIGHFHHKAFALLDRKGRRLQEPLVKKRVGILIVILGDYDHSQLLELLWEGQQQNRGDHIESAVTDGDPKDRDRGVEECKMQNAVRSVKGDETNDRSDQIERNVHGSYSAGSAADADTGQQRRDAGADILSHDDGDRHAEGNSASQGQSLKDTHGSR